MQKKFIALAVAALASGAAFAQSNVTVYGVADAGFEYGDYGNGSKFRVQSGQSAGSRIGFKGEEALGNGLTALFTLEMGISLDNGQLTSHTTNTAASSAGGSASVLANNGGTNVVNSNPVFQRQAFVGLKSATMGQVTFGRQYTPAFYVKAQTDTFGLGMGGTANNAWAKLGAFTADRLENEVQYMTPSFGGFTAALGYSSGTEAYNTGVATTAATNNYITDNSKKVGQTWGALGQYANGPVYVGLAYHDITGAVDALDGNNAKTKGWILGGSYDFKVVKAFLGYARSKTDGTISGVTGDGDVWNIGVKAPFGAHSVGLQYSNFNDKLTADADFAVWGVGYEYAMSKRTSLYAGYAKGINKNNGVSTLNTATNTGMAITSSQAVNGSGLGFDPSVWNFGMRHSF